MKRLDDLKDVIRELHGSESTHVKSVPVTETFQGRTVWDGVVEVFRLHDHPKAEHVYAWSHNTDNPQEQKRHVVVLHIGPITSPLAAVRAAIVQEFRNAQPAQA